MFKFNFLIIFLIFLNSSIFANTSYNLGASSSVTVNKFNNCKVLTNSGTLNFIVPTGIANDWSSFLLHLPVGVVATGCCTGGKIWDGSACVCPSLTTWDGSSCAATCTGGMAWNGTICECPMGLQNYSGTCLVCPPGQHWGCTMAAAGSLSTSPCPHVFSKCVPLGGSSGIPASAPACTLANIGQSYDYNPFGLQASGCWFDQSNGILGDRWDYCNGSCNCSSSQCIPD
ncbi:MAG: hypothetical protein HOP07_06125 [Bacteriovoracaceae bacterium]|nr:hypothetical protein [Bacteriovoracaceae bacterium]